MAETTIIVTITNNLNELLIEGEADQLTDEEIIELVQDDLVMFCDGAKFLVTRAESTQSGG